MVQYSFLYVSFSGLKFFVSRDVCFIFLVFPGPRRDADVSELLREVFKWMRSDPESSVCLLLYSAPTSSLLVSCQLSSEIPRSRTGQSYICWLLSPPWTRTLHLFPRLNKSLWNVPQLSLPAAFKSTARVTAWVSTLKCKSHMHFTTSGLSSHRTCDSLTSEYTF